MLRGFQLATISAAERIILAGRDIFPCRIVFPVKILVDNGLQNPLFYHGFYISASGYCFK